MKRAIIKTTLTMLLAVIAISVTAQNINESNIITPPEHEIKVQISDGLPLVVATAFMDITTDMLGTVLTFGNYKSNRDEETGSPHLGLGYKYHVNDRFSAGANLSYQSITTTYKLEDKDDGSRAKGERKISLVTIMPSVEYKYLKRDAFQLYGNADIGIAIGSVSQDISSDTGTDSSSGVAFAFQANPVGMRIGKQVAGFIEVGAGFKGFVTLGLTADF